MAITFTSWTNGTEGGNPITLNWGTGPDDLKGKVAYRYLSALGQALNERTAFATNQSGSSPDTEPITEMVPGLDIYDWQVLFHYYMTTLLGGTNGTGGGSGAKGSWVNYLDNAGDWNGVVATQLPTWEDGSGATLINWLIAQGTLPAGSTRLAPTRGKLLREWMWQQYAMLNAMRWLGSYENSWSFSATAPEKIYGSDPDWATIVSDFNAGSFYGDYVLKQAGHYVQTGDTPEYLIYRGKLTNVSFSGIPTHINHQLIWYRQVEVYPWSYGDPSDYENNDFGAGEDELWAFYTSSVGNPSSRSGITLGDYNSGNNSIAQPVTPDPGTGRWDGYQILDYSNSRHYLLFKLNVPGGLKFVA